LDWRAGRKFSGNCWSGVNYAWCDLRFQPPAKIGRSQRSVKVGFDTLSWASHPSESGNSPLKSGLSLHLLAGHHEIIGLEDLGADPMTYVIGRDGKIVVGWFGYDSDRTKAAVEKLGL
jgi:hypothetical protein